MFVRALTPTALAVALALPFATVQAQQFHYAPGTSHYRMTVDAKVTQTVMGQSNDATLNSGQKFTMALAQQAPDTLAMTVTIDSIGQTTSLGPTPGLDSLVGQKVQAFLSPTGEFYAKHLGADTVAALASIADQLVHILPRIRVPLAKGATWSDTLTESTLQSGLNVKRQVISTFTVAGDTTIGGATAWEITRKSNSTTSGLGNIQGQNATMDGTSTGSGLVFLTHDGTFVGGTGSEDVKAKLTLTDAGVAYDIGTSAHTKIERMN
ncbi:MAG: hypothetical protein KGL93_08735 [Gemmatimonadota bacterium]|nr:hypothetical protein [Gemmatimonadota bacterium]